MPLKLILLSTIAMVVSFTARSEALYKCDVISVVQLNRAGELVETDWTNLVEGLEEKILFDSKSGIFRYSGDSDSRKFDVFEAGDNRNALKAVRFYDGMASKVLETFRINTFANSEFIYVSGDLIRTGTCKPM